MRNLGVARFYFRTHLLELRGREIDALLGQKVIRSGLFDEFDHHVAATLEDDSRHLVNVVLRHRSVLVVIVLVVILVAVVLVVAVAASAACCCMLKGRVNAFASGAGAAVDVLACASKGVTRGWGRRQKWRAEAR